MKNIIKGFYLTLKERNIVYKLFAFYIIVYLLLYIMLKNVLKPLDYIAHIGNNLRDFDFTYLLLLLKKHPNIEVFTLSLIFFLFILYFFYSQYILKGFTEKLGQKEPSFKNYRKILLSWVYFIPLFIVVILLTGKLYLKSRELIVNSPTSSSILYYLSIILSIILFIYIFAIFDTTRINSIYKSGNSLKEFFKGFGFAVKNYLKFFLIYLIYGIGIFILLFIFKSIIDFLGNQLWKVSLILVFIHLIYFFLHLFLKFSIFSSEFSLIKSKENI